MAKVFISHSSADKDIVRLFKDKILKSGIGLADNDIFFTSSPETGIPVGKDIPQYIKKNMVDCEFVFLMISENYKKSEVCLNEMGAAMVHDKKLFPILLYNYAFDKVGWLIDRTLCIRIDEEERLDEIRDVFCAKGISTMTSVWNRYRNEFMCGLQSLEKSDVEVGTRGLLDCQLAVEENQDAYKRNMDYLNEIISNYTIKARSMIEAHNASSDCQERKAILINLATVLTEWADEMDRTVSQICNSLFKSLDAVAEIFMIKTLPLGEEDKWIREIKDFQLQCVSNCNAIMSNRQIIESQVDMEQNQILAKKRLLKSFDSLVNTFDISKKRISEIIYSSRNKITSSF